MYGRIIAYHRGSPDVFAHYHYYGQTTIDSAYVDGVSLTHGPALTKTCDSSDCTECAGIYIYFYEFEQKLWRK